MTNLFIWSFLITLVVVWVLLVLLEIRLRMMMRHDIEELQALQSKKGNELRRKRHA